MPLGSPLCFDKRTCKYDFGSPLQSGGKTHWCGEDCGSTIKVLLLAKTLIGYQQLGRALPIP